MSNGEAMLPMDAARPSRQLENAADLIGEIHMHPHQVEQVTPQILLCYVEFTNSRTPDQGAVSGF